MARRRTSKRVQRKSERVAPSPTLAPIRTRLHRSVLATPRRRARIQTIIPLDDGRIWRPRKETLPMTMRGEEALIAPSIPRRPLWRRSVPHRLRFVSKQTSVCVRRSKRRQAMFAAGKAGGRVSHFRQRRKNRWSEISC